MICVIFVILLLFLVIYGLIAMMVPELIKKYYQHCRENSPRYIRTAGTWVTDLLKDSPNLEAYSLSLFYDDLRQGADMAEPGSAPADQ